MASSVRIFVSKQKRIDHLTFQQGQMVKLGTVGNNVVRNRQKRAINTNDAPAKRLGRGYAIWKTKKYGRNKRDLEKSGRMWKNLDTRTVKDNRVSSGFSTRRDRAVALENQKVETFLEYSNEDARQVAKAGAKILVDEIKPRLIVDK